MNQHKEQYSAKFESYKQARSTFNVVRNQFRRGEVGELAFRCARSILSDSELALDDAEITLIKSLKKESEKNKK